MKPESNNTKLYPTNIEEKLGFDKIKNILIDDAYTDLGKQAIHKLIFLTDNQIIHTKIQQVLEMNLLLQSGHALNLPENLSDSLNHLKKLDKERTMLYEDELQELYLSINAFQHNFIKIKKLEEQLPRLNTSQANLKDLSSCVQLLQNTIDKEGKLKPDASPLLWSIYKKIAAKEKEVRKMLLSKFQFAKKNGWAGDTEITIRNERLVIPIIAEFKKKIQGFVHDDSQSGKFLYIEPVECFEENNELKELEFERKKEIENILRRVTAQLSPYKQSIWNHIQHSVFLDITLAKSNLSSKLNAIEPLIANHQDQVRLVNARHPLLYLYLQKDNKKLVPLNFWVDENCRMVLISGPNAGGKSIALKTVGLIQYMYQCGLPVPVDVNTKLGTYANLFIDIGDNQSIENNLSSYSSHLMNMCFFMENADKDTLYLIDELGNGTDPTIGSAMAQSILEKLFESNAFGIITTHFGSLKAWANYTKNVQNARMQYDVAKLEPLFTLELGKQGSSFALEVASKAGVDKGIIDRAKGISKNKQEIDLDELIAENERYKNALEDANKRIADKENTLHKLIAEYENLKVGLSNNKQQILNEAKVKATQIVTNANKQIETTIKVIQETKADKKKTQKARKQLSNLKQQLNNEIQASIPLKIQESEENTDNQELETLKSEVQIIKKEKSLKALAKGDMVKQAESDVVGEVLQIKNDKAHVAFGFVKMWVDINELRLTKTVAPKSENKIATFNARLYEKQTTFQPELDVRGRRGDEAITMMENWLEDAHLLGFSSLKIIHGRGFGILRKLIMEKLQQTTFVKKHEYENEQLGGNGVTLVYLK